MAADYLWLWDNVNSVWVKAQCDPNGKLLISDLDPFTVQQTTPENLKHVPHGYYAVGTSYLPYAVDSAGKLLLSIAALQHLSDIADVNLTGLTTGDFIYWDASTSKWKRIAHKDATTGVHGAGSSYLALFGAASTVVSKFIWKDTSERALIDSNRTTQLTYTDLDLTATTSATAKFVLLQVTLYVAAYTSGRIVCELRKNGTTPAYAPTLEAVNLVAGAYNCFLFIVGLDAGQVMEYQLTPTGTATFSTTFDVLGYIE